VLVAAALPRLRLVSIVVATCQLEQEVGRGRPQEGQPAASAVALQQLHRGPKLALLPVLMQERRESAKGGRHSRSQQLLLRPRHRTTMPRQWEHKRAEEGTACTQAA